MASVYQHGLGGTTGHELATSTYPFWALSTNGVWYVGPGGVDGAAPAGGRREAPLATLAQAHTNASAYDTIVLLASHTQTLGSAQTFNKAGITLVSEGTGSSRARFTCSAAVNMFDVTAAGVQFLNIYFPASTGAATSRIRTAAAGTIIEDCQFDCGASDTNRAVQYINGASYAQLLGTTFTSTAATPAIAFEVDSGATMAGLRIQDVIVDGGSFGWTTTAVSLAGTLTGVKAFNVALLNNSDLNIMSGTKGYWSQGASSGSAYIFEG